MVARLDGSIVRDIVKADGKGFMKGLALWFLLSIPSTITNSMVDAHHFYAQYSYVVTDSSLAIPVSSPASDPVDTVFTRPLLVFQPRFALLPRRQLSRRN